MVDVILKKQNVSIGKRKQAVARVFLVPGKGNLTVNKVSGEKYLQYNETYLDIIWEPFKKVNLAEQFDIIVLVRGGGLTGQTEAIRLAVARQLCKINEHNRPIFKSYGFLTRDARIKERKKYGLRKARKAPQYSKR